MKKLISIFIIVMIIGTMFAGCDSNEAVAENNSGLSPEGVEDIIYEDIIYEDIIYEDIITENVITEDID